MVDQTEVRTALDQIEQELRKLGLWSSMPPSPEALQSVEPFCVDTLSLSEWLQWILIPRMNALLDGGLPLPGYCQILPIAEESFKELKQDHSALLDAIDAFDKAL
ncbi:YqcC family protein [Motiliproteus coralliicola]|uniref:YqcC family protein n=1 Tax=Motiliproteus coralliicola TaxID=2283196 RepID=A0A369WTI8_9GAMM|nr:YqcC family protein [Motiliproteus coralliicola]RDE24987.1 YqcC family protein [Motiliproteus coralliicola]